MSVHLIPQEAQQETYERMSPRYITTYKKTNEQIFKPNHETLNGLAVASEYVYDDPQELQAPHEFYDSYPELLKDVEINKKFTLGKPIVFTGTIGSETYQNKVTTYGRLRISKICDVDIDKIGIFKGPYERISAGSGAKLYQYLQQFPDGVERIRELQKYALKVVTKSGVVTFDFSTLYLDTDTELYQEIRKIADDPGLTDKQKMLLLTTKYADYGKEIGGKFSSELKDELAKANRVKLYALQDVNMPQFIIQGVDEKPIINHGSLLTGLTESDYQAHAVENRSLQSIKVMGVPSSGYVE